MISATFTRSKETKGAVQYRQDDPGDGSRPAIGTIYLTKPAAADLDYPDRLTVTVEAG